ncbi:MAG: thioredoxin-disulfide reductase [Candidatus Margulisiibacteriota bacterium]|jgi:thioredoxin reductase (NADPH)
MQNLENIIIIGSGPAGLTAAIYLSRDGLKPLLLEEAPFSGQLTTTPLIENFPGFVDGINGLDLAANIRTQAEKFGVKIVSEKVLELDTSNSSLRIITNENHYVTKSVLIASGASPRRLNIPGEDTYWQRGISVCATCDGALPIFREKNISVIGGGDSAIEEALHLCQFAKKVNVIIRRDVLRASQILQDRALNHPKINLIKSSMLIEALGDNKLLSHIKIKNVLDQSENIIESSGLFYAIGHDPNTEFVKHVLPLTKEGYLTIKPDSQETVIPGVFAAGDVCDSKYRQAIVAAGSGARAAIEIRKYLR